MPRNYTNIAADATLSASVDAVTTTMTIDTDTGWPDAEFTARVGDEVVLCTARTTTTLTVTRGYDGTTATSHASGAPIWPVAVALDFSGTFIALDDPNTIDDGSNTAYVTFDRTAPQLILESEGTGIGNQIHIAFEDSTATRRGWIGFGNGTDTSMSLSADSEDIDLFANSNVVFEDLLEVNTDLLLNVTTDISNTTWSNGAVRIGDDTASGLAIDRNELQFAVVAGNVGTIDSTRSVYFRTNDPLVVRTTVNDSGVTFSGTGRVSGDMAVNGANMYSNGDWYIRRNGAADTDYYWIDDNNHRFYVNGTEEFRVDANGIIIFGGHTITGNLEIQGQDAAADGTTTDFARLSDTADAIRVNDSSIQLRINSVNELSAYDSSGTNIVDLGHGNLYFLNGTAQGVRANSTSGYVGFWSNSGWRFIAYSTYNHVRSGCDFVYNFTPTVVSSSNSRGYWDTGHSAGWRFGSAASSTQQVKKNIEPHPEAELWGRAILETPLKSWTYDAEALANLGYRYPRDGDFDSYGFVAEEMMLISDHLIDYIYDSPAVMDGMPLTWSQVSASQYMWNRTQDLRARIEALSGS